MIDMRPQLAGLLVAGICGEARHHARWRELSSDGEAAAVAAPRELGGGIGPGHTRDCRKNGRFPDAGTPGGPTKSSLAPTGCTN
jgi:hypothetical protein